MCQRDDEGFLRSAFRAERSSFRRCAFTKRLSLHLGGCFERNVRPFFKYLFDPYIISSAVFSAILIFMNGPSYFEIQADDVQRALRFYEGVFGWKFTEARGTPTEYWRI